jgi:hypothetical protein
VYFSVFYFWLGYLVFTSALYTCLYFLSERTVRTIRTVLCTVLYSIHCSVYCLLFFCLYLYGFSGFLIRCFKSGITAVAIILIGTIRTNILFSIQFYTVYTVVYTVFFFFCLYLSGFSIVLICCLSLELQL